MDPKFLKKIAQELKSGEARIVSKKSVDIVKTAALARIVSLAAMARGASR